MSSPGSAERLKEKTIQQKLTYPLDVEDHGHFMIYLPKEYRYTGDKVGFAKVEIKDSYRPIVLPLPRNLAEAYGVSWETESIGAIASNISAAIKDEKGGGLSFDKISSILGESLINVGAKTAESSGVGIAVGAGAKIAGTGTAGSILSGIIAETTAGVISGAKTGFGIAANPYLALLFHGVGLRSHSFQYEFFAKSPEESREVKKIIDRFRYCMLPSYNRSIKGSGRALFNFPNIFHIGFMDNTYLYSFKPCALTNMSINYHQQGDAFYFDLNGKKVPASIQLSLEFRELEIIVKDDFEDDGVNPRSESTLNNIEYSQPVSVYRDDGLTNF